jgi:hypothetical protein
MKQNVLFVFGGTGTGGSNDYGESNQVCVCCTFLQPLF